MRARHRSRVFSMAALIVCSLGTGSVGLATAAAGAAPNGTATQGADGTATPGASAPGASVPDTSRALVSLVTNAPDGPFSSGQYIEVKVGSNSILEPGARIHIEECDPLTGEGPWQHSCDRRTVQSSPLRVNADGSADYVSYPIYALPDPTVLGEHPSHHPSCDLTHACVLFVGQDFGYAGHHVLSAPFYVNPTPGDTGANPGNGLPEAPYVLALPVLAVGVLGGSTLIRRRRSTAGGR